MVRFAAILSVLFPVFSAAAQQKQSDADSMYGSGAGGIVLLSNNGFGVGGYGRHALTERTSLVLEFQLSPGRDDRELRFQQLGSGIVPNKRNYFLMLPVYVGMQQRLFAGVIEDNFRPFVHLAAGFALGWEYPYFQDRNGNNIFDEAIDRRYGFFRSFPQGKFRPGISGSLSIGAHFGAQRQVVQGVRFGYAYSYFFDGVQLLEPDVRMRQFRFHSPIVTLIFGRIF